MSNSRARLAPTFFESALFLVHRIEQYLSPEKTNKHYPVIDATRQLLKRLAVAPGLSTEELQRLSTGLQKLHNEANLTNRFKKELKLKATLMSQLLGLIMTVEASKTQSDHEKTLEVNAQRAKALENRIRKLGGVIHQKIKTIEQLQTQLQDNNAAHYAEQSTLIINAKLKDYEVVKKAHLIARQEKQVMAAELDRKSQEIQMLNDQLAQSQESVLASNKTIAGLLNENTDLKDNGEKAQDTILKTLQMAEDFLNKKWTSPVGIMSLEEEAKVPMTSKCQISGLFRTSIPKSRIPKHPAYHAEDSGIKPTNQKKYFC